MTVFVCQGVKLYNMLTHVSLIFSGNTHTPKKYINIINLLEL